MAAAVEAAIANKRHHVVQAGTGTGKTLACLVPTTVSGGRCVVATATNRVSPRPRFDRAMSRNGAIQ